MTEIHRNLIFFDKNKRTRTWINEEEMDEFRYHQVRTMLTSSLISGHQMKFYYKSKSTKKKKLETLDNVC